MFEILSETNRFERYRDIAKFVANITKDNWRGVLDAYAAQRRTEGRKYNGTAELHVVLERIGELAGHEALMEYAEERDDNEREIGSYLIRSWASADLKAATDWYRQLDPAKQPGFHVGLLDGMIQADLRQALDFALEGDVTMQQNDGTTVMRAALTKTGFDAAEKLLAGIDQRSEVPDASKGSMFTMLAKREIQDVAVAGNPLGALAWYGKYLGKTYVGPDSTQIVIAAAAAGDPDKTLSWLQAHGDALTSAQRDAAYPALLARLRERMS
jgi:hypothetical protein